MAINSSGIRDTERILSIAKGTVISTLKKADTLIQVNPNFYKLAKAAGGELDMRLEAILEVEADEQWSYVGDKSNQRWLWHTVDHATKRSLPTCLASVGMWFLRH